MTRGKYSNRKKTDSKYHAEKTKIDGIQFDSKKEADYYCELKMLKMAGEVKEIDRQVVFELLPSYKRNGKTVRAITYRADFVVTYRDGSKNVIDVKGYQTDVYKLKKKMLLYRYPDINFQEV